MENKDFPIYEFNLSLIADFFKSLDRQGPGGEEATLKALGFIPALGPDARILDMGCGTGSQTAVLAKATGAMITALDLLPEMTAGVSRRMRELGLGERVETVTASMCEHGLPSESFDLIWAEGSIYNIGFEEGFRQWNGLLKQGGHIAVTDCCWISAVRPDDWAFERDFPEISPISEKTALMERAGYTSVAHFILPADCWTDNYYIPLSRHLEQWLVDQEEDPAARRFAQMCREEMAFYRRWGHTYGYVFFIGRKD